ncbi:MAG: hypothetical protein WCC21_02215 [Candidatus Acidiferrales bacterium]
MRKAEGAQLARGYSVERYRRLEAAVDKNEIANLLSRRFTERYLAPSLARHNVKHGFTTMAVGCLMLEALESFRQGWPDTKNRSKEAFCSFFDGHDEFSPFRGHGERFYYDVRCGILHQAETRGRWKIRRKGPLFDEVDRAVNATSFVRNLGRVLKAYCRNLKQADWDGDLWKNCRKKMDAICKASIS